MYKMTIFCDNNLIIRLLEKMNFVEITEKERLEFYD